MPVAVTVEFDAASYTAIEGRGAVTITVTLSADPERSVTIPITVIENGGADTNDYTLSANSVTIAGGSTSATFTVTATDDDIYDGEGNDETLTLGFGTPPDAVSEGNQATTDVSLIDNEVLVSSDLVPVETAIGGGFRLLFVTSGEIYPTSSDIDVYNQFVQDAVAGGHADIQDYRSLFRALASTASVSALDNTATRYTSSNRGVPIWWLNGANVADHYRDFYDDSWDQGDPGSNETGSEVDFSPTGECRNSALVWTGTSDDGEAEIGAELGDSQPAAGLPCRTGSEIHFGDVHDTFDYPLYGLSFVLRAAPPTDTPYVTGVVVDPEPANGVYYSNHTITVAVTFSEAVSLSGTGTPTFTLEIGANTRAADYDSANSTDTVLVFTYQVTDDDTDLNGISSTARTFDLPSTASITRLNESAVAAYLGPIALSTDFGVNAPPRITGIEVTSTPKADPSNDTYGLGEDIEITVTFNEAVNVTGDEVEGDIDFGISVSGPRRAPLKSGNGTTELVFAYTVQSDDTDDNGIFIVDHTHSTNPTFFELQGDQSVVGVDSGLDALLEHKRPGAQPDHKVDGSLTVADATLSALSLSGITLDQTFTAGAAGTAITSFTATTTASITTVTATPTLNDGDSVVVIDPIDADGNVAGHQVSLAEGVTEITVSVLRRITPTVFTSRAYTITVTRDAANGNRAAPSPPKNVRAVEEKGGVRLTWQAPDGATVTGYRIERRPAGEDGSGPQRSHGQPRDHHTLVEDTGSADTGYTDESAERGVEYEYRVTARNESGPGEGSDWVRAGPASASNAPATGLPTISGTAQVGETLTAGITGIADADGLSGESFTYQWVSGDGTTDTDIENATGATYKLVDADQGRSVKVRVTFTDDGGNEETLTSAPTAPVLGDGRPGAPRNLAATAGNREVTLSWDPPADNGNAPATGYRIEWRVDGKDYDKTIWGTAGSTTYTTNVNANLANGVKYFFRVSAGNGSGNSYGPYGPASGEVSATPTSGSAVDLGTPVLSDTENLHHGMVRLDWEDIEDAGWYVVQYYHVEGGEWLDLPAEGVDIAFHGSSAVVSNLHGLSWLRVGAMSCAGASEWSQIEQLFGTDASDWEGVPVPEVEEGDEIEPCPVVLGTPVLSDTETLHHGMVQLNWEDIEDAGWYVVQYYHLDGGSGEWVDLPAVGVDIAFHGSSAVVSNLHGLSWLRVRAMSCAGESEWSQIEQLFGTKASDWEGVPVPEVEEGDEIEPCSEDADTPDNSPATGAPTIGGTAQVGQTLTANTSGIADADGLTNVSFTYQWLANDTDIAGASGSTYTLTDSEESKAIKVEVSFTDDAGNDETLTTATTDAVAAASTPNSPATGAPTISGTIQVGETLSADTSGVSDADGLSSVQYEYQWLADDTDIAGATGLTYTLTDSEESKAIKVEVSFTDDADNEETLTSAATGAVDARPNSPATGAPTIAGTAQVGQTVTADTSGIADVDGLANATFSYQWLADDTEIAGATGSTYTLTDSEESKAITVQVSFTDDAGNEETLTSAATAAVAGAQPTEPPDKPTGLEATATHHSVTLTWDDPGDDSITGYVILRRIPGVDPEGHFDVLVADTGTAATTYTDNTVSAETRYTYRIKAINGAGTSERSRWSHIDVPAAPVPDKPTGLEATESDGQVVLTWDDPGDDSITGYVILRRVRENDTGGDFSVLVADTGTAATTYTDDTVAAGTTYTYRIKAINEHGTSERSRWYHIDIPEAP